MRMLAVVTSHTLERYTASDACWNGTAVPNKGRLPVELQQALVDIAVMAATRGLKSSDRAFAMAWVNVSNLIGLCSLQCKRLRKSATGQHRGCCLAELPPSVHHSAQQRTRTCLTVLSLFVSHSDMEPSTAKVPL